MHPVSQRLIELSPARVRPAVALVVRTIDAANRDRLPGLAAELAFWVLLSLPALLLGAFAVAGFVIEGAEWQALLVERVIEVSRLALTPETIDAVVRPVLDELLDATGLAVASFAFVATVWVASRAVKVVLQTVALTYDGESTRSGWHNRLLGFGITLGAMAVGLVLAPLLVAGPNFGEQLVTWIGYDPVGIEQIWRTLYFPATIVVATLAVTVVYHVGVPGKTAWRRNLPGAVLATTGWLLGSAGLRWYGTTVVADGGAYGPLSGPIVALLWLWVSGFAVLLGAELNAQIQQLWPVAEGARQPEDGSERSSPRPPD